MTTATIRPRTDDDLPGAIEALRIVQELDGYPTRWPADPAGWLSPDGTLGSWIGEYEGNVVGGVGLVAGDTHTSLAEMVGLPAADVAVVTRLFVAPAGRGLGLAKRLVNTTVDFAHDRALRVALDVIDDSAPAVALYESLGWTLCGTGPAQWQTQAGDTPLVRYYLSPKPSVGQTRTVFTREELAAAADLVHRTVPPTPTHHWPLLDAAVGVETWVKHENHTPVGAFKVRGGLVYVDRLRADRPDVTGLVSATRGNHGQSIALAATRAGLTATIVVPHGNSADKNDSMRALGADLIEHGHDFQAAREHATELAAADPTLVMVPSFHADLVLGVATYALEFFEQAPPLRTVYVPVGMGSGICGLIAVRDLLGLDTELVGVVSEHADATALSFEAGDVVPTDTAHTFVDGVATRTPDGEAIRQIIAGAARIVAVSDDEAADAMRLMLRTTHNLAEPAGALALAGLVAERPADGPVGIVHTGGNLDTAVLADVLAGRTPSP